MSATTKYDGTAPARGLDTDTPAMRLAWQFLLRRIGDGTACAICGAPEDTDHEPTDECGIVANLLHDARRLRAGEVL
jgi:hypothetical protein